MLQIPERRRSASAPCSLMKQSLSSAVKLMSLEEPVVCQKPAECTHPTPIVVASDEQEDKDKEVLLIPKQLVSELLQQAISSITSEVLMLPPPDVRASGVPPGRCCVCLSPDAALVYKCSQGEGDIPERDTTIAATSCEGALCLDCMKALAQNTINNSIYSVPPIRCPGRCFSNIPTAVWRFLLSGEEDEVAGGDVEETLMKRYEQNATALLSIRCGSCDETYDMSKCTLVTSEEKREALVTKLLQFGPEFEGKEKLQEDMFTQWVAFMNGRESAEVLVRSIVSFHDKCSSPGEQCSTQESDEGILSVDKDHFIREYVLPLMLDLECRSRFLLTLYRTFPKFSALCCEYGHCFVCKVDQWHEGITCEENQRKQLDIEAQFCPDCNIPTIRTDGCDDMLCVCGNSWEWMSDDDDSDY